VDVVDVLVVDVVVVVIVVAVIVVDVGCGYRYIAVVVSAVV